MLAVGLCKTAASGTEAIVSGPGEGRIVARQADAKLRAYLLLDHALAPVGTDSLRCCEGVWEACWMWMGGWVEEWKSGRVEKWKSVLCLLPRS